MSDEEVEKFEITDYDLENEFNINRPGRRVSKNEQIYGKLLHYSFWHLQVRITKYRLIHERLFITNDYSLLKIQAMSSADYWAYDYSFDINTWLYFSDIIILCMCPLIIFQ
jgi:hypothetical protein